MITLDDILKIASEEQLAIILQWFNDNNIKDQDDLDSTIDEINRIEGGI